jgi:Spy/CpxP family protein refolding chaperone
MNEEALKTMIKRFPALCMAAGLFAALSFAQSPQAMTARTAADPDTVIGTRVSFLAAQLNLTAVQKTRAMVIFRSAYAASRSIQSNLESSRRSLEDAVKRSDLASIDRLSVETGTLNGQLTAVESRAQAAFYAILTKSQRAKYDAISRSGQSAQPGNLGPSRIRSPKKGKGLLYSALHQTVTLPS